MYDNNAFESLNLTAEALADLLDKTRWASSEFDWQDMLQMAKVTKAVKIKQDAVLWQEGDHERYMGIILKGGVTIQKLDTKTGEYNLLATLKMGQSLGEMSLIDKEPRSAKAIAATEVTMLVLNHENLEALKEEAPQVASKFIWKLAQLLSQRLRKTTGQLVDFLSVEV